MESNDKQQIGGYFSTKNASKDEALKGIQLSYRLILIEKMP